MLTVGGLLLLSVILRVALPHYSGVTFAGRYQTYLLPYNRVAFWACVAAAFIAAGITLFQMMLLDLGLR
ncbi:MAG: hypothetical protein P8Z30_14605 [Acidobacteriota bacterium]